MFRVSLTRARIALILWTTTFVGLLWVVYVFQVVPVRLLLSIHYYPQGAASDTLYFFLSLVPTLWLPTQINKPSELCSWMLYITIVIPSCIESPHLLPFHYPVWPMVIAITLAFILLMQVSHFKPLKLPRLSVHPLLFWTVVILFSIIAFVSVISYFGMPKTSVSLITAETLRAEFKDKLKDAPALARYPFRWEAGVILPLVVAYGIVRRKPIPFTLAGIGSVSLFLITTYKEFAMIPLLLIGVAIWLWVFKKNNGVAFVACMTVTSAALAIWTYFKSSSLFTEMFFTRFILGDGEHTAFWYQYFSTHPHAYYGASFGRLFITQPRYYTDAAIVVGNQYYQAGTSVTATSANAHFWADAFGNAGWPGFIIISVLVILLLWIVDSSFTRIDKGIGIVMGIMVSLGINNSGLQTSLFTSGIVLMIIIGLVGERSLRPIPARPGKRKGRFKRRESTASAVSPMPAPEPM